MSVAVGEAEQSTWRQGCWKYIRLVILTLIYSFQLVFGSSAVVLQVPSHSRVGEYGAARFGHTPLPEVGRVELSPKDRICQGAPFISAKQACTAYSILRFHASARI